MARGRTRRVYAPSSTARRGLGHNRAVVRGHAMYGFGKSQGFFPESKSSFARGYSTTYRRKPNLGVKRSRASAYGTKCKISKLCKFMNQQQAVHVHRQRSCQHAAVTVGSTATFGGGQGGKIGDIETAAANLRFYDPGTDNVVVRNLADGTYSRDVNVSLFRSFQARNNYKIPVRVEVYSCTPKMSTNDTPIYFWEQGLIDQNNPSKTSPLISFKDSIDLKNTWTCKRLCSKVVEPGKSCYGRSFAKEFMYNFSTNDANTLTYQKTQGGHYWVYRLTGVLGHDSVLFNTEIGNCQGGVDVIFKTQYTFKYDAGKDLHDYSLNDTCSTAFTNTGVVSERPIALNEVYTTGAG